MDGTLQQHLPVIEEAVGQKGAGHLFSIFCKSVDRFPEGRVVTK